MGEKGILKYEKVPLLPISRKGRILKWMRIPLITQLKAKDNVLQGRMMTPLLIFSGGGVLPVNEDPPFDVCKEMIIS